MASLNSINQYSVPVKWYPDSQVNYYYTTDTATHPLQQYYIQDGAISSSAISAINSKYSKKEGEMDLVEALFLLKPKLAEAYKTEDSDGRAEFKKDLMAAAEAKKNQTAATKLSTLLELEA